MDEGGQEHTSTARVGHAVASATSAGAEGKAGEVTSKSPTRSSRVAEVVTSIADEIFECFLADFLPSPSLGQPQPVHHAPGAAEKEERIIPERGLGAADVAYAEQLLDGLGGPYAGEVRDA